jgi:hypothetical protein
MDFHYLAQSMEIDEEMCTKIDTALKEFHTHKSSAIAARFSKEKAMLLTIGIYQNSNFFRVWS